MTDRPEQDEPVENLKGAAGEQRHVPQPGIRELPLVALRETVIFPEMIVPLQVGREKSVAALNAAVAADGPIALVTQRQAER
jgi:ATP-dependent Lon protease